MKKKALVLAVCMAIATPTITAAKALPNDFLGLSLGEIQAKSFLNEPFKGIIPILFTNLEASKDLKVKLASESVFQRIGAEKLSILDNLEFKIQIVKNKPVIIINSTRPIDIPFLNFVLEIESPNGSIYQDYTTLLDPKNKAHNSFSQSNEEPIVATNNNSSLATFSFSTKKDENRTHTVKSGDTLSEIAKALNSAEVSLKKMITAIHQKNPSAFIKNNINKLKAGAVLQIPNQQELINSNFNSIAKKALAKSKNHFVASSNNQSKLKVEAKDSYKIKKGDTLSGITKKLGHSGISFTKMMKAIHAANPHAFSKNKINLLIAGRTLQIPSIEELSPSVVKSNLSMKDSVKGIDSHQFILEDSKIINNPSEFKLDGFVVEKGDTLSSVAKQIGYKNISLSKMMQAIYIANPGAFKKNNITLLVEGSIIRLPSINEVKEINNYKAIPTNKDEKILPKATTPEKTEAVNHTIATKIATTDKLEKRIRELKRDLNKANAKFSNLESTLKAKETLIKKQSDGLKELAFSLTSLKEEKAIPTTTVKLNLDTDNSKKTALANTSNHLPKVTISPKLPLKQQTKHSSLLKVEKSLPLSIEDELLAARTHNSYIPANFDQEFNNTLKNILVDYGIYMSGKELLSTILALLLGLLLIRYRREIYSYTNISYDHPKYYPPLDKKLATDVLKEKSITFHDSILDTPHKDNPNFSGSQIEECEELVEELIDDLNIKTNESNNTNWDHLNKACDDYLTEFKNKNSLEVADTKVDITKPEEMDFELFEALAEGVAATTHESNSAINNDDTLIYDIDAHKSKSKENVTGIPPIFDDLVKTSEDAEVRKLFMQ